MSAVEVEVYELKHPAPCSFCQTRPPRPAVRSLGPVVTPICLGCLEEYKLEAGRWASRPIRDHLVPACEVLELFDCSLAQLVRESEGVAIRVKDIEPSLREPLKVGRIDWNLRDEWTYEAACHVLANRLGFEVTEGSVFETHCGLLKMALEATSEKPWVWR